MSITKSRIEKLELKIKEIYQYNKKQVGILVLPPEIINKYELHTTNNLKKLGILKPNEELNKQGVMILPRRENAY